MQYIELSRGIRAMVDDEDYEWLSELSWHFAEGYARNNGGSRGSARGFFMHRAIMNPPDDMEVDHIDGDKLNNQRANLRVCTRAENAKNRLKNRTWQGRRVTSRYKGVSWATQAKQWTARIHVKGKQMYLGYFDDELEAAMVYDIHALEHYGEYAQVNFPTIWDGVI
jgi:hypothetical protein